MTSENDRIEALEAQIAELRRATFPETQVSKELSVDQRREILREASDLKMAWEAEVAQIEKKKAAAEARRKAAQEKFLEAQNEVAGLQHELALAGERYRAQRDPLWQEMRAGAPAVLKELVRAIRNEEERTRASAPEIEAINPRAALVIHGREARLRALGDLQSEIENSWDRLPDNDAQLWDRFNAAMARLPRVVRLPEPAPGSASRAFA